MSPLYRVCAYIYKDSWFDSSIDLGMHRKSFQNFSRGSGSRREQRRGPKWLKRCLSAIPNLLYRTLSTDSKSCARCSTSAWESIQTNELPIHTNTYLPPLLREALVKDGKGFVPDSSAPYFTEMEEKYNDDFAINQDKGKPRAYYEAKFSGDQPQPTLSKIGELMSVPL